MLNEGRVALTYVRATDTSGVRDARVLLPAGVVTGEIVAPRIIGVVDEDGDDAFHLDLGVEIASQTIGAAGRRTNRQRDAFLDDLRNCGKPPVGTGSHQQTRADG